MEKNTLTIAQIQMQVTRSKEENIRRACRLIRQAAGQGAELAVLPEMFCCPYENSAFHPYGEALGGPAQQAISALARELGLDACLLLEMRLGEGSGCPLAFQILKGACAVMCGMGTFQEAAIDDDYLEEIRAADSYTVVLP